MDSMLQQDMNNLNNETDVILILNVVNSGLKDDFKFETAMRLLPLSAQASVLRKKFQDDKIKTLCNRLLQLYGCLLMSGIRNKHDLKFKRGKFGKPILDYQSANISFSMTNGEEHICMYIKKNLDKISEIPVEVGIDIASVKDLQKIEELELYKDVFTEVEYETLSNCPKEDIHKLFAHYWSLKESYTKYLGTGLNIDLKQVDIGAIEINQLKTITDIHNKSIKFQSFWVPPLEEEIVSICHDNCPKQFTNFPKLYKITVNQLLSSLEDHV